MSRREIVLLVARAVAALLTVEALIDSFVNLPLQVFLLSQHLRLQSAFPAAHISLSPIEGTGIVLLLLRIVLLWLIAGLFWRCGPFVERLLAPANNTEE